MVKKKSNKKSENGTKDGAIEKEKTTLVRFNYVTCNLKCYKAALKCHLVTNLQSQIWLLMIMKYISC